jgi:hypothetical protein
LLGFIPTVGGMSLASSIKDLICCSSIAITTTFSAIAASPALSGTLKVGDWVVWRPKPDKPLKPNEIDITPYIGCEILRFAEDKDGKPGAVLHREGAGEWYASLENIYPQGA